MDKFPILGGRLLKRPLLTRNVPLVIVSNPWREAIEAFLFSLTILSALVSNPWREAIEAECRIRFSVLKNGFQSLEGGY